MRLKNWLLRINSVNFRFWMIQLRTRHYCTEVLHGIGYVFLRREVKLSILSNYSYNELLLNFSFFWNHHPRKKKLVADEPQETQVTNRNIASALRWLRFFFDFLIFLHLIDFISFLFDFFYLLFFLSFSLFRWGCISVSCSLFNFCRLLFFFFDLLCCLCILISISKCQKLFDEFTLTIYLVAKHEKQHLSILLRHKRLLIINIKLSQALVKSFD